MLAADFAEVKNQGKNQGQGQLVYELLGEPGVGSTQQAGSTCRRDPGSAPRHEECGEKLRTAGWKNGQDMMSTVNWISHAPRVVEALCRSRGRDPPPS